MSAKIKVIANFYNRLILVYNPVLELLFKKGRKITADELNKKPCTVLEIGCNQGQLAIRLNNNVTYTGIDVADKVIVRAIKTFSKNQNINFLTADGENNKFKDESFDIVTLLYVLSVSPNPNTLLSESWKLLKPGGKLLVVNHFSNAISFKILDTLLKKFFYAGVNFYFPISLINQSKGFNIVKQKKINFFWTYLELEKI